MSKAARRLRRILHRRGPTLHVGRPPLPAVEAFVEAHRSRFRPGVVTELIVLHETDCPYPGGGPCVCPNGPEIRLSGDRPEEN